MIAKNGIDWDAMGFTVYGKCPAYQGVGKSINTAKTRKRNVTYTKAYRVWSMLLRMDRGWEWSKGELCEEWKEFENFEKWFDENYYEIPDDKMEFSFKLFNPDNTYISPETSCFLPLSINKIVSRKKILRKQFIEFAEKYKDSLPKTVYEGLLYEEVKDV